MASLRVTSLKGRTAGDAPTLPDGAVVTGVTTSTSFDGNLIGNISGNATGLSGTPDINVSFLNENTSFASTIEEMNKILNSKGGFVEAFWNGESKTEQKIKELTKATIRCIPLEESNTGKCIFTGQANSKKVLFARAY